MLTILPTPFFALCRRLPCAFGLCNRHCPCSGRAPCSPTQPVFPSFLFLPCYPDVALVSPAGRSTLDLREYYQTAAGELKPGKKGIALTPPQWHTLVEGAPAVTDRLRQKLGGSWPPPATPGATPAGAGAVAGKGERVGSGWGGAGCCRRHPQGSQGGQRGMAGGWQAGAVGRGGATWWWQLVEEGGTLVLHPLCPEEV